MDKTGGPFHRKPTDRRLVRQVCKIMARVRIFEFGLLDFSLVFKIWIRKIVCFLLVGIFNAIQIKVLLWV